jgi:hypothetical protein
LRYCLPVLLLYIAALILGRVLQILPAAEIHRIREPHPRAQALYFESIPKVCFGHAVFTHYC